MTRLLLILFRVVFGKKKKKMNNHKNQLVLTIFLFFDDYEVGNPLGSKSGVHKLEAFI